MISYFRDSTGLAIETHLNPVVPQDWVLVMMPYPEMEWDSIGGNEQKCQQRSYTNGGDRDRRGTPEDSPNESSSSFLEGVSGYFSLIFKQDMRELFDFSSSRSYNFEDEVLKEFTTSGCLYLGRIIGKLEEGRIVWLQSSNCSSSFHDFGDNFKKEQLSSGPRGTTPADDRYIVLQARRNRRQNSGRNR
ncbi:hypothetical protein TNCV_2729891 [Trichonephila clavipes]|nr:hypothetical protein TNCV_2729891 [Trichonephila clavipes]